MTYNTCSSTLANHICTIINVYCTVLTTVARLTVALIAIESVLKEERYGQLSGQDISAELIFIQENLNSCFDVKRSR